MALLFGDILAISKQDVLIIYLAAAGLCAVLLLLWRPMFASTVSAELAEAEGMRPRTVELVFMLLIAALVALALKLVGALLITALLLIPAASARRFASSPESMALVSMLLGGLSVVGGLSASLFLDTPAGPSIVVSAGLLFLLTMLPPYRNR